MSGTLNKVMLIGNVGAEIKVHQFDNQNKIGNFPLATSETYTSRETGEKITQTEWHNIVVRGTKLVEVFEKYVNKGDKLYVEGRIRTRKWQDQNGQDRYTTEIILNEFTFLTPKGQSQQSQTDTHSQTQNTEGTTESQSQSFNNPSDSTEEDDLPF